MTEQIFEVRVKSPYGNQPIQQFKKHLLDISSESLERWGIEITVSAVEENEEDVTTEDFSNEHG